MTKLENLLAELKQLDINGWCCATDGSLDDYSMAEQIDLLTKTIETIKSDNA